MRNVYALSAIAFAAVAALNTSQGGGPNTGVKANSPPALALLGKSEKICQLDGEKDWASGAYTAARTMMNAGLDAADLGYPVEHNGKLLFFFGDSWPPKHPGGAAGEVPPDDAVGVTTRTRTPDSSGCVGLKIQTSAPKTFARATVTGPISIHQGFFNVPSGAVDVAGKLYAFFWTNHCDQPSKLMPSPSAPLAPPTASAACPESAQRNSIGQSVLARSHDDGLTFTVPTAKSKVVSMPIGFVYTTAIDAMTIPGVPAKQRLGVFILGVPRYRASVPYLAFVPEKSFADPSTWKFFSGRSHGKPKWVSADAWAKNSGATWAPPGHAELFAPGSNVERCIGEFSITWNAPLQSWLLLYNCGGTIEARIASAPWGPWSAPSGLIAAGSSLYCTLIMGPTGCGAQRNFWPKTKLGKFVPGGFYAPFVLDRYTLDASAGRTTRAATIFWVVSTWNPYEVIVMRTTLASDLATPTPLPRPSRSIRPFPVGSRPY